MRLWKHLDLNEDKRISFREGLAGLLLGLVVGGGLMGGWLYLLRLLP